MPCVSIPLHILRYPRLSSSGARRQEKRTLLSGRTLSLGGKSYPDEAVLGLELLHGLGGVVDEGEAGGLAATELGAQTEDGDLVLLGLVQAAELLAELILGDVGAVGVEDIPVGIWSALGHVAEVQRKFVKPGRRLSKPYRPEFHSIM